jgi:pyridoxine 4-dehydrogenase
VGKKKVILDDDSVSLIALTIPIFLALLWPVILMSALPIIPSKVCRVQTLLAFLCWPVLSAALQILPAKVARVKAGPILISSLGAGTWAFGNRILYNYDPARDEEIYQGYKIVRDAGVTLFDTADSYGTFDLNGRAEILLGEFERRYQEEAKPFWALSRNDEQQVATKLAPYPWRIFPQSFVDAARASLERLQQKKLCLVQLHWSTARYQPFQERALWEGLAQIYEAGLCEAVGVSNYGPVQLQKISAFLQERQVPLATAQIQYSLLTYKVAKDMNSACDETGCRLIAYSPLCLGLLTGK